jgi:hypothetical protein
MASERNAPPADEDDIVEKKASHPVTTTLLIVSAIALICSIVLTTKELGKYVNPETRRLTNGFKVKAVTLYEQEYEKGGEGGGGAEQPGG